MKKYYSLSWVLLLLPLCFIQCDKENLSALQAGTAYKGQVKVKGICGRVVISITNGDLAKLPANSFAETWTDESTGKIYRNVFMISNICQVKSNLEEDDQITFRVHPNPDTACIVCTAYSPAPKQQLPIEVIE